MKKKLTRRGEIMRTIAIGTATAVGLPIVWIATLASWNGTEWAYGTSATGPIGTSSLTCDAATTGFSGDASGRLLAADALNLGVLQDAGLADLNGLTLNRAVDGTATVDPTIATNSSTATTSTYTNPLAQVGLLGDTVDLGVPAIALPLDIGNSLGVLNEYASVGADGQATGASGTITADGGLVVTAAPDGSTVPYMATVKLSSLVGSLLPGLDLTNLADLSLGVGAVEGHASIDGCALARSVLWGTPAPTDDRGYWIAGLGLDLTSPLVGSIVTPVANGILPAVNGVVDTLIGSDDGTGNGNGNPGSGSLVNGILGSVTGLVNGLISPTGLLSSLTGLSLGSLSGSVSLSGIGLSPLQSLLTSTVSDPDGLLSINLGSGVVHVNLAALLGDLDPATTSEFLNGLAPNTELLLNQAVVDTLTDHIATALDAWGQHIVDTLTGILRGATLNVSLDTSLSIPCDILVLCGVPASGAPINLAGLHIGLSGAVGAIVDNAPTGITLDVNATQANGGLVSGLLSALGVGNLVSALTDGLVNPLLNTLVGTVGGQLTSTLLSVPGTISGDLLAANTGVVSQLLSGLVSPLLDTLLPGLFGNDGLLSLMVNVQPDKAGAPPGLTYTPAVDHVASQEYAESALRLAVAPSYSGTGLAVVTLASASAGPVIFP